eukprot:103099_1
MAKPLNTGGQSPGLAYNAQINQEMSEIERQIEKLSKQKISARAELKRLEVMIEQNAAVGRQAHIRASANLNKLSCANVVAIKAGVDADKAKKQMKDTIAALEVAKLKDAQGLIVRLARLDANMRGSSATQDNAERQFKEVSRSIGIDTKVMAGIVEKLNKGMIGDMLAATRRIWSLSDQLKMKDKEME